MPGIFLIGGGRLTRGQRSRLLDRLIAEHRRRSLAPFGPHREWIVEKDVRDDCALACCHLGVYVDAGMACAEDGDALHAVLYGNAYSKDAGARSELLTAADLLRLYRDDPGGFAGRLEGTYVALVRDAQRDTITITNDRIGYLPHYWAKGAGGLLALAPDATCLTLVPGVGREVNGAALRDLLSLGLVLGDDTLLSSVQVLPPASVWTVDGGGRERQERYWHYRWEPTRPAEGAAARRAQLTSRVVEAVTRHAPPGGGVVLALSGGMDSRFIAWALAEAGVRFRAVTVGEEHNCDVRWARQVATALGLDHRVVQPDYSRAWSIVTWEAQKSDGLVDPYHHFVSAHLLSGLADGPECLFKGFLGDTLAGGSVLPSDFWLRADGSVERLLSQSREAEAADVARVAEVGEAQVRSSLSERAERALCAMSPPTGGGFARYQWLNVTQRQRKRMLYGNRTLAGHAEVRAPFCWGPLVDTFRELPLGQLFAKRHYRRALAGSWPEGGSVPWSLADLPPTASVWRILLRRVATPGRLPEGVRRLWQRILWSPDHPGHAFPDWERVLGAALAQVENFLLREGGVEAPHVSADGVRQTLADYRAGRKELAELIQHVIGYTVWHASLP